MPLQRSAEHNHAKLTQVAARQVKRGTTKESSCFWTMRVGLQQENATLNQVLANVTIVARGSGPGQAAERRGDSLQLRLSLPPHSHLTDGGSVIGSLTTLRNTGHDTGIQP